MWYICDDSHHVPITENLDWCISVKGLLAVRVFPGIVNGFHPIQDAYPCTMIIIHGPPKGFSIVVIGKYCIFGKSKPCAPENVRNRERSQMAPKITSTSII